MKKEKYSQELLNSLLDVDTTSYNRSKYSSQNYISTKPYNLKILKYIPTNYKNLVNEPSYLCECDCGLLALKKCSHVINGNVRTCGMCSTSRYNSDSWIGFKLNNFEVVDIYNDDLLYFKVRCLCCNSIKSVVASNFCSGIYTKCVCYHTLNYKDITKSNNFIRYIDSVDVNIIDMFTIDSVVYYKVQCARCNLQKILIKDLVDIGDSKGFKHCICKRIRTDRTYKLNSEVKEKRRHIFEYANEFLSLEGKRQGNLFLKKFNFKGTLKSSTFTCDCDCGNKNVELLASNIASKRTTQCGKCLVAHNVKYNNESYIGKVFRFLKVLNIFSLNGFTIWECECLNCGRTVSLKAVHVISGNNSSCGCLVSIYESLINVVFTENKVDFNSQVSFDGLLGLGGGLLRFDFVCKSKTGDLIAIEYNGLQHYQPVRFSDKLSDDMILDQFKRQQEHDRLKDIFCKDNNIKLYKLFGKIEREDILSIIINENL